MGISPDALYRRYQTERGANFSVVLQEKRAKGEALLHAKQFSGTMRGDRGMPIWLGKLRLGQKDRQRYRQDGPIDVKVAH